ERDQPADEADRDQQDDEPVGNAHGRHRREVAPPQRQPFEGIGRGERARPFVRSWKRWRYRWDDRHGLSPCDRLDAGAGEREDCAALNREGAPSPCLTWATQSGCDAIAT